LINTIVFILLISGIILSALRVMKGPTIFDRVLGLDVINLIIIGLITLLAMIYKNELYIDIVIVYSILAFIETIVFARILEVQKWIILGTY